MLGHHLHKGYQQQQHNSTTSSSSKLGALCSLCHPTTDTLHATVHCTNCAGADADHLLALT
jgi:hypothetical protein